MAKKKIDEQSNKNVTFDSCLERIGVMQKNLNSALKNMKKSEDALKKVIGGK